MEPTEAINGIEASLRLLIRTVLGNAWTEGGVLDISMLEARREEERKRRDGAACVERARIQGASACPITLRMPRLVKARG
jgi:hypothetical protein